MMPCRPRRPSTLVAVLLAPLAAACGDGGTDVEARPPEAPVGVTAEPASHTEVDVGWTSVSDVATGFRVERAEGGADFDPVGSAGAGEASFRDGGLEPGTRYSYRVLACNDAGCSEPAGPADATTDAELVILTTALERGEAGEPYEDRIEVSGGGTPPTWAVASGALPAGLALDAATGDIEGTPEAEGFFPFDVEVASRGQAVTASLHVQVGNPVTFSGVVFEDADRSGAREAGEAAVPGAVVTVLAVEDGSVAATLAADQAGVVTASLPLGTYRLAVTPEAGLIGDPAVLDGLEVEVAAGPPAEAAVPMVAGAQAGIGPGGGDVVAPDGTGVSVPAGALDGTVLVSVVPTEVTFDGSGFPGVELYPSGAAFDLPVELSLPVEGAGASGQVFFVDDGGRALWEATVAGGGVVRAWPTHFSTFFFDGAWRDGALEGGGAYEWAAASVPTRLAGPGTAGEAREDAARGVGRWRRIFDAADAAVARNDGAADPFFRVAAAELGPCDPEGAGLGSARRSAALGRDGTIWLNDACLWSTSAQLAGGEGPAGISIEGAVAHQVGHLMGLPHAGGGECDATPVGDGCASPPTMSAGGEGDLGPLWPEDLELAADALGLPGDWAARGVAEIRPTDDWVDGQEVAPGGSPSTLPGALVLDAAGDPVPDVTVLFQLLSGTGQVTGAVAVTGADGVARPGGWTAGSQFGSEVLGASFYHRPARTDANEAAGALTRFAVEVPPPLVTDAFSALVFGDADRSGAMEVGEAPVPEAVVKVLSASDGSVAATLTADDAGMVTASLRVGTYRVAVSPRDGLIGDPAVLEGLEVNVAEGATAEAALPMIPGGQAEIGPAGGEVAAPDGTAVDVPAGALDETVVVSVVPTDVTFGGSGFPGVELYPSGRTFDLPVELSLPVDGADEAGQVFFVDGAARALREPTVVGGGTVRAWPHHFSTFFFDDAWGGETLRDGGAYTWAVASVPARLAGSGTAGEARDDAARGVGRWGRIFEALGATLTRNDGASSPFLRVAAAELGPCGPDGTASRSARRTAALGRDRTLWLNDACLWSTSAQLASGDGSAAISIEGVVAHQVGHLMGLSHAGGAGCEANGGAGGCASPPTMSAGGEGDLGPLWPEDLALAADVLGLAGDWAARGVAEIRPTDDWVDGQEVAPGGSPSTLPGALVLDAAGDPVPDVTVLFQLLSGNGQVTGAVAVTGADGIARPAGWTAGTESGNEVLGASFYHRPSRTAANDAVDALARFTVDVPGPPVVEDFLTLEVGTYFRYAASWTPTGGETVSGERADTVRSTRSEGGVTWFLLEGDGPISGQCEGSCEVGFDPGLGEAYIQAFGYTTRGLVEPIAVGAEWSDPISVTSVDWTVQAIHESLEIEGTEYESVVEVEGEVAFISTIIRFFFADGVGLVRVVYDTDDGVAVFDLVAVDIL